MDCLESTGVGFSKRKHLYPIVLYYAPLHSSQHTCRSASLLYRRSLHPAQMHISGQRFEFSIFNLELEFEFEFECSSSLQESGDEEALPQGRANHSVVIEDVTGHPDGKARLFVYTRSFLHQPDNIKAKQVMSHHVASN